MIRDVPISVDDPINAAILSVSEDKISGFIPDPIGEIAKQSDIEIDTVIERLHAMLEGGTIRRIRQTFLTTSLAPGALIAWQVSQDKLNDAFDYMFQNDPFSGHVVIRTTDQQTTGSAFRLWTTLKVPVGFSMQKHCDALCQFTGAERYILLPAKKLFALGVGHVRRRGLEPGARTDEPARMMDTNVVDLNAEQWQVLTAIKRELTSDEITQDLWANRAAEIDMPLERFLEVAGQLSDMKVVGRFSTFLEHVKKHADGKSVTRYNALFHWRVPSGREIEAGMEVGRHHIMTHAYWREGGDDFSNVNIMGVAHGTDKDLLLAHKAAIDEHLREAGMNVDYTNVFWGGRSEIKPSEFAPDAYADWCRKVGLDVDQMRA